MQKIEKSYAFKIDVLTLNNKTNSLLRFNKKLIFLLLD
jgi:hypothetical protein